MDVYRIAREIYIGDINGEGAKKYGGRWNQKGTSVLYTSQHESLATLELLVHTPGYAIPKDLKMLVLTLPDKISSTEIRIEDLPSDWDSYPAPDSLAKIGTKWVNSRNTLICKVPSVIIPSEWNILINPAHREISRIERKEVRSVNLDGRLKK